MKEFNASSGTVSGYLRALIGGKPSSGKTSLAATAPAPVIFGDLAEGGFETLKTMARKPKLRSYWWDSAVEPKIWAMENMLDYRPAVDKLKAMVASKSCPFKTLVFDSLSIYGQRVLRELRAANPTMDPRQHYGGLQAAMDFLISEIHTLPLHVIWLCHVTEDYQLTVPGKATAASWAYMSYKWLIRADVQNGNLNYQLHTQPFRTATWLGGRGEALPSPMIPSFKCILPLLGFPDKPVSPAVPDYLGQEYPDGAAYA